MKYLYFRENVLQVVAKSVDVDLVTEYGDPIIVCDSYVLTAPLAIDNSDGLEGVIAAREKTRSEVESEQDFSIKRQISYPAIGDQLDALFKAGAFPADMAAQIQAVKDANPKPTGE